MRKPYKPPTYAQQRDISRVDIQKQAEEYAAFVKHRGIKTLYLYPERKGKTATSNRFRFYLECALNGFERNGYTIREVEPTDTLGPPPCATIET